MQGGGGEQVVVMGDLNALTGQMKDNIVHDAVPDSMSNHVYSVCTHSKDITNFNSAHC